MSTQFGELEQTRQQIDRVLQQDVRVAADLQSVEQDRQQFYSIEQTKSDQRLIDQALADAGQLKLTNKEQYRLRAIQGRNISHLLLNQNQFSTDSPEMAMVKADVGALEQMLGSAWDTERALDSIVELESAYQVAIASCKNYCSRKNPTFRSGKERKQMVEETLQHLQTEAQQIHAARAMAERGELPQEVTSRRDLLVAASQYTAGQRTKEPEGGIAALTYADFASMLGTHNRGQIAFSGNGLQMINNGVFSSAEGTVSAENFEVRTQLYVAAMQKMGEQMTPEFAMHLQQVLGLDTELRESKPLSRKELYEVITEVNLQSSQVAQTLKEGEQAPESRRVMAEKVTQLIGGSLGDWDVTYTPQQVEQEMKAQITAMLKNAAEWGIQVPKLSRHQMDVLVKGNLPLLRDQLFASLNAAYDMRCRMNAEGDVDVNEVAANDVLISQMLVYEISKITAETAEERKIAEHEQKAYITGLAFMLSDKEDLGKDFEQSRVGDLAVGGSAGLAQAVDERLPECEAWRQNRSRMKRGYDGLVSLCDRLQTLTQLQERALYEDLTDAQRANMQQLAAQIQNMLQSQPDGSANPLAGDMEFVAQELKGSRFAVGFATAKARVLEQGFSFEEAAGHITAQVRSLHRQRPQSQPEAKPQMSETVQRAKELGSGLSADAKQVLNVLLLQKQASELAETGGEDTANQLAGLHRALRRFSAGVPHAERVNVAGATVQLMQSQSGVLSMVLERRTIMLPYTAAMLAERMETDMMTNESLYEKKDIADILRALRTDNGSGGDMVRVRNLCLKLLQSRTGQPSAFFNNISDRRLKDYALFLVEGVTTAEAVIADVNKLENSALINGEEALALLKKSQQVRAEEMHVEITRRERVQEDEGVDWQENESKVKNLLSDLFFSTQTWELDENERSTMEKLREAEQAGNAAQIAELRRTQSAERMRRVVLNHTEALYYVVKDPQLLNGMLDKLPFPADEASETGQQAGMKQQIQAAVHQMLDMPQLVQLRKMANGPLEPLAKLGFQKALGAALYHPDAMAKLAELDTQISRAVEQSMNSIQQMINTSVSAVFRPEEQDAEGAQTGVRRENYGDTPEEKKRWQKDSAEELNRLLRQAASGERGQGLFTKNVFQNYFQGVSRMDQRAMLASALRGAKPFEEPAADASPEEAQAYQKKVMGNYLGGVLKGAGPLLQKMLQGMPLDSMPEELKSALKDMRSNLAPIPEELVRAQLRGMIERSQGKVTDIKVERALGAASVGQAFLCKFKGPDLPEEGQDVVVKLLRPNVRNHMMREKDIMLRCAKMTDHPDGTDMDEIGGMEATYRGQLLRIEEELDLTIEAQNVERGRLYDEGVQTVQAMKVNPLVEPTVNAMVLEKAPGTTLDKYMDETRSEYREEIASMYVDQVERLTDMGMGEAVRIRSGADFAKTYTKLTQMYDKLVKRQKYLTTLANKWVTEGVFGRGFYHGDLHAGNIMVDDERMTIIDFGNATKLDEVQQSHVVKMMLAAGYGMMDDFRHSFHMLLQNTPEEKYQEKREALGAMIEEVFQMGTTQDTGARIAVVLLKAQELGLELPPAIANFSQSQIRLQQTIEEMNTMIETLQREIVRLADGKMQGGDQGDLMTLMLITRPRDEMYKEIKRDMPQDISHDAFINVIRETKTEEERQAFEQDYIDGIETEESAETIQTLRDQLHALWEKQDDPDSSEEERVRQEDAFHKNYMKQYIVHADQKLIIYKSVQPIIETPDAELLLGSLLQDASYKGKELRETYQAFCQAHEQQSPELEEKKAAFVSQYLQIQSHRMTAFKEAVDQPVTRMEKPETFFSVMSDVIMTNKKAALDRLGFLYSMKVLFKQQGDDE